MGFREDTLYITLYTTVEKSQERIVKRGDSLDEEYHNKEDLRKYNARFAFLAQHERVNFIKRKWHKKIGRIKRSNIK